jgi:GAF domain-containing protein
VGDVSTVENYLACSPRTKSELVVLIRAGDDIFGQIDIDAREKNAFPEKDENNVRMIADKLAEVFVAERRT